MRTCVTVTGTLLYAALSAACGSHEPTTSDESFELVDGQDTFSGTGRMANLAKADLATYLADRAYLRKIAPRGQAVEINHADPRQHRFAMARVRIAGKTPENSPALFQAMSELVRVHTASRYAVGTVRPAAAAAVAGGRESQHAMLTLGKAQPGSTIVVTSSLASRTDHLSHGFVDCIAADGEGNALGDSTYVEVFGDMKFFAPQCTGDLSWGADGQAEGDSFLSETVSGGPTRQSYVAGATVSFDALAPALSTPTVNQPADLNADNKISVCLDRTWTGDCDINNTGFGTLKLPLKGSVAITNGTFDFATIAHYQTDRPDTFSHIFVSLVTNGGGCAVPPTNSSFTMVDFWKQVSAGNNGTTLSWDLSTDGAKWAQFSADCRLVQDRVDLTMQLRLPFQSADSSGTIALDITTVGNPMPPNFKIPFPIQVTNSCLAEGTTIATSAGGKAKIEDLHIGDQVANPYATRLTITDTAIGTERQPMVRIADQLGHELLMTEMHPLYVIGRGMVPARHLKVGDRVTTQDGPSELVRVTRESYPGKVYNLKVGNAQEASALGVDQTTVFANGFLVGDGQIQNKYEFMDAAPPHDARISSRWKADYLASVARAGQRAN
jgi:hypothetical protein